MMCIVATPGPRLLSFLLFPPYLPTLSQTSKFTTDPGAIQKAADFVKAFMLGFDVEVGGLLLEWHPTHTEASVFISC